MPEPPTGSLWSGRPEVSTRRLGRARRAGYAVAAPVLSIAARSLWSALRFSDEAVDGRSLELLRGDRPLVPCFWHADLVACLGYLLRVPGRAARTCLLVSPSVDGELVARVVRAFGVAVVRGSSTRTGGKAIRLLYRAIVRDGLSPIILPDGPHGPPRCAKPGAVMLSQLAGAPIVPMAAAGPGWRLGSWDRLQIPRPLAAARIAALPPIEVPRDLPSARLETEVSRLERALEAAGHAARTTLDA